MCVPIFEWTTLIEKLIKTWSPQIVKKLMRNNRKVFLTNNFRILLKAQVKDTETSIPAHNRIVNDRQLGPS